MMIAIVWFDAEAGVVCLERRFTYRCAQRATAMRNRFVTLSSRSSGSRSERGKAQHHPEVLPEVASDNPDHKFSGDFVLVTFTCLVHRYWDRAIGLGKDEG